MAWYIALVALSRQRPVREYPHDTARWWIPAFRRYHLYGITVFLDLEDAADMVNEKC